MAPEGPELGPRHDLEASKLAGRRAERGGPAMTGAILFFEIWQVGKVLQGPLSEETLT